jgi:hypothetical protein
VPALGLEIGRKTVGQVRVSGVHVHMVEEVVIHVVAVGIRVGGKKANVFVEVERAAKGEIKMLFLMVADQVTVNAFHGLAGGEAENEVRIGAQFLFDNARD